MRSVCLCLLALPLFARVARAQDADVPRSQPGEAVLDGASLPLGLPATRQHQLAAVSVIGGYDSARDDAIAEVQAAMTVTGRLSIHGGAIASSALDRLRPSIGGMFELLRQPAQGVDAAIAVTYRPEGLTEPEGEIEVALALARRIGDRATLLASATYGQDPEGNERDAELRAAGLFQPHRSLLIGGDARVRVALQRPDGSTEPDYDAVAGPLAVVRIDGFAITGQIGASAVNQMTTATGAVGLVGVCHVF
jgi:hypothetical protein